jgi:hypothetical protein
MATIEVSPLAVHPKNEPHSCIAENAPRFLDWIRNRGGVAVWHSVNLANPGASWSTPALTKDGDPTGKPTWQAANQPARIITSTDDILVDKPKEIKRFHVAVRMGSQGMSLKVTDGGSRRIEREVAKAGYRAWYEFDYETQEAVILVPDGTTTLTAWAGLANR